MLCKTLEIKTVKSTLICPDPWPIFCEEISEELHKYKY